jgi:aminoglycoside phosphotransferase family enzyme
VIYLAGRHAYNGNKPAKLGFADFANLAMRQRCCADEVRFNRRLENPLHLSVATIVRRGRTTQFDKGEPVIRCAVHMRRFTGGCLFSDLLGKGRLGPGLWNTQRTASRHFIGL